MKLPNFTNNYHLTRWPQAVLVVLLAVFGHAGAVCGLAQEVRPEPVRPMARDNNRRELHPLQRFLAQQMRFIVQLDLTDDQRAQLRAILPRHDEEWQNLNRQTRQARAAYQRALMSPEPVAPEVLAERSRALGQAETAWAELIGRIWYEVRQTLTPEQLTRFRELRMEQMKRRLQRNPDNPDATEVPPDPNQRGRKRLRGRPNLPKP